jgi:hypothetical protein
MPTIDQECSAYRLSERMRKPFSTQKAQRRTQKAQKKRDWLHPFKSSGLCFLRSSLCFLCSISAQSTLVPNTSGSRHIIGGLWLRYFFKDHKRTSKFRRRDAAEEGRASEKMGNDKPHNRAAATTLSG